MLPPSSEPSRPTIGGRIRDIERQTDAQRRVRETYKEPVDLAVQGPPTSAPNPGPRTGGSDVAARADHVHAETIRLTGSSFLEFNDDAFSLYTPDSPTERSALPNHVLIQTPMTEAMQGLHVHRVDVLWSFRLPLPVITDDGTLSVAYVGLKEVTLGGGFDNFTHQDTGGQVRSFYLQMGDDNTQNVARVLPNWQASEAASAQAFWGDTCLTYEDKIEDLPRLETPLDLDRTPLISVSGLALDTTDVYEWLQGLPEGERVQVKGIDMYACVTLSPPHD